MKKITIKIEGDERPERVLTAYRYDPVTCIFAGQVEIYGERCGNGDLIYRLPANSTMEEAPIVEDGQVAVFLERTETWFTVADHRGETWYDWKGDPVLIGRHGNPKEWGLRKAPSDARADSAAHD